MEITDVQQSNQSSFEMINILGQSQDLKATDKKPKKEDVQGSDKSIKDIPEQSNRDELAQEIASVMNHVVKALNTHLSFKVNDETGRMIIQVIDSETGEIRRQIPPEEMLKLTEKMRALVGVIFDKQA